MTAAAVDVPEPRDPAEDASMARSGLTDADRVRAREVAAAMPPWTPEQLDELDQIVDAAPALARREPEPSVRRRAG